MMKMGRLKINLFRLTLFLYEDEKKKKISVHFP